MSNAIAEVTGKVIEAGNITDYGRGITLEVDGEHVSFIGLEIDELRVAAALLGERVVITIRRADSISAPNSER